MKTHGLVLALVAGIANSPSWARPGPDLLVGDLPEIMLCGSLGPITAYAVGSNACNGGDAPVDWYGNTAAHPVIAQNMYRLKGGRLEQLGQSWVKHGFGSENGTYCASCTQPPGGSAQLGVGCSDMYYAETNGYQVFLGPRWQVSATTGVFAYPSTGPAYTTVIDRRLQVYTLDVTPGQNPGAMYFVEVQYVTADDAQANNGLNNASYKQILISSEAEVPIYVGGAHPQQPAIRAWKDQDPAVTLVAADYVDAGITARFWVGAKATNNGDGTWRYEYAVHNLNSDRAAGMFRVPIPGSSAMSNPGFHAPVVLSGSSYDDAPWASVVQSGAVQFSTISYATNPDANAIRWGTLYNFRFDANTPPTTGTVTIGLFAPGNPASVDAVGVPVPGPGSALCYANCDSSTVAPILNVNDYLCFLNRYAAAEAYANCDGSTIPPAINVNDFQCFINAYASGCR